MDHIVHPNELTSNIIESYKNEINTLKQEILRLQGLLEQAGIVYNQPIQEYSSSNDETAASHLYVPEPTVSKKSSSSEKIALFMSLFHGRTDVFAKRWENAKSGKSGYSPACENEWVRGLCKKPCSKCTNASYRPYSSEVVQQHLKGNTILGIYAIQPDDSCWFLAIDFDEASWVNDIKAVRTLCATLQIPCAVEKSRSGNGAHIWFFFSEAIPAATARQMGSSIITSAMKSNARLSFSSYDRMFPNQDTMPKGGFGNLIALPLQPQAARTTGGSLFIDESGNIYPDQWSYLSSIQRISLSNIISIISKLDQSPLGTLISTHEEDKPWKHTRQTSIPDTDPTHEFHCILADKIYISTENISNAVQDQLKRLAAFRNPEFYQKQAAKMTIRNTPRIICCAEYQGHYLTLPRGSQEAIDHFASEHHISVAWEDEQSDGIPIDVSFSGSLYPDQQIAFDILRQHDKGVLSATTAFGKTVIGAALIADKKKSTLILVHRQQLMDQWKERLEEFLVINEKLPEQPRKRGRKKVLSLIGTYGGGQDHRSGIIDIAMMQSLERKNAIPEWIGEYGLVIVDECHHVPAVSFESILMQIRARYTYGLTATPRRRDGHHPIIPMYLGPIRYQVNAKDQAAQRPFSHVMIPRFTGMSFTLSNSQDTPTIGNYYSMIAEDDMRNHLIVDDVISCVEERRNCLVLSERVAHVEKIAQLLSKKIANVFVLTGGKTASESNVALSRMRAVPQDIPIVVCATGKYIGEGFDESRLDTLFLGMPVSWEGILAQYAGRLHRLYKNKTEVRVYDYIDDQIGMLERMYYKRLKTYASLGYRVCGERSDTYLTHDIIYDQRSFIEPFLSDIRNARHDIFIVSPFIKEKRVQWLFRAIQECQHPLKITIVTRPPEAFQQKASYEVFQAIQQLTLLGAKVMTKDAIHQKFATIDNKIVWYGSINLLSFGSSQESMIRIVTGSIAEVLQKSVQS